MHAENSSLTARRSGPLKGRVRPPGDKSISHRAFLFGLLTRGGVEIHGLLEGDDVLRTGQACRQLGAQIVRHGPGRWSVHGPGLGALLAPREVLDFGNAGTGSRLMMGVVAGHPIQTSLDGVFAAGDIVRGASLVVWGIRDGRDVAASMHAWLKMKAASERVAA